MEFSVSIIGLLSAILSFVAIFLAFSIIGKVYQQEYKRPWFFIGVSAVFFALSEVIRFITTFFNIQIFNTLLTDSLSYLFAFISIAYLTYGLLLESLILKYYKGKFVKFKFIPVQEGSLGGELDIDVSRGNGYFAIKKDRNFLLEQFSEATKAGFEGFLIGDTSPREIRTKYNIAKTPILWLKATDSGISDSVKQMSLDDNSDILDPIKVNEIISYVDNFLEQSQNPFVMLELNQILETNNITIIFEFLRYINSRVKNHNGICVTFINNDSITEKDKNTLHSFLLELE